MEALTKYGRLLKQQILEDKPEMFKTEKELHQYCLEKENRAIEQRQDLVANGMSYSQAEETIWPELMEAVMYQEDEE